MNNTKFSPGDRVVAKFLPIDPHMSRKVKKNSSAKNITIESPSPLTIAAVSKQKEGYLLTFKEWPGTFESCFFRTEEEDRIVKETRVQAETSGSI